jgi:hypothetical protein
VADRPAHDLIFREKQREDFCRNHDGGYGMSRVVWHELMGRARADTRRRLAREYARVTASLRPPPMSLEVMQARVVVGGRGLDAWPTDHGPCQV